MRERRETTSFPGKGIHLTALFFSVFQSSPQALVVQCLENTLKTMSRQKKKNQEEEEVQVIDEAPQAMEEPQVAEEEMPMGPHPVSMLQVCA